MFSLGTAEFCSRKRPEGNEHKQCSQEEFSHIAALCEMRHTVPGKTVEGRWESPDRRSPGEGGGEIPREFFLSKG